MSYQPQAAGGSRHGDAGDSYFAPLASARYVLLITFKPDGGSPMSSSARVVVDGDRAYFRIRNGSATSNRLRRNGRVQVAPGTVLGLCSFGPPFNATARPLAGAQAGAAARKLAGKQPAQRRWPIPLPGWMRRWQAVHYELLADEATGNPRPRPGAESLADGMSGEAADRADPRLTSHEASARLISRALPLPGREVPGGSRWRDG